MKQRKQGAGEAVSSGVDLRVTLGPTAAQTLRLGGRVTLADMILVQAPGGSVTINFAMGDEKEWVETLRLPEGLALDFIAPPRDVETND